MAENIKCKNEINVDIIKESMNDCFVVSDMTFSFVVATNLFCWWKIKIQPALFNCGIQRTYERASPKYIHVKVLDNICISRDLFLLHLIFEGSQQATRFINIYKTIFTFLKNITSFSYIDQSSFSCQNNVKQFFILDRHNPQYSLYSVVNQAEVKEVKLLTLGSRLRL